MPWRVAAVDDGRFTKAAALGLKVRVLLLAASPLFNANQPYLEACSPEECLLLKDFVSEGGSLIILADPVKAEQVDNWSLNRLANKGYKVVFTPGAALYFDWYQATPDTQPRAMRILLSATSLSSC